MRRFCPFILLFLFCCNAVRAEESVPSPAGERYPNIRASLEDGFYALAEQQARGVLRSDPNDAEAREAALLLSHALWGQTRYSEIIDLLNRYDGQAEFVYWRARALYELHRYQEALEVLDAGGPALSSSSYYAAILQLKGRTEQLSGQLDEAETTYELFARVFPNHDDRIDNQFNLAAVYLAQKRIPEATSIYETLIQEADLDGASRAKLKLARILYTSVGNINLETARSLLNELAEDAAVRLAYRIDAYVELAALEEQVARFTEVENALRGAVALAPDARLRVSLKLSLARMMLRQDRTAEALTLLEECRTQAPDERVAAELQLEKAGALLQAKSFSEANDAYQVYLDVADDPDGLAHAYLGKGLTLWGLGRYAESGVLFDKAAQSLEDRVERAAALLKAGDAYYESSQLEEAEKRYRTFISEYPGNPSMPNALYQLGLVLAGIGRRAEALTTFGIVEESHPASPFAEKAALRTADVMLASGQWAETLEKYEQIGNSYTNEHTKALSLQQRGIVLYHYLKRYDEAQGAFEQVLEDYPDSDFAPQAAYMRGFCLYALGEVDEAIATCAAFIEKYPDSEWTPEVMFWLAEHYYNQGLYEEAKSQFLRISQDFSEHRLAPRSLYWAGRAAAAQSNYMEAIERYGLVTKNYAESDILAQTRFAQGDALTELGEFSQAILAFDEIIQNYPESPLVNAAWGRKGDCQFSLAVNDPALYQEAINSFQGILDRPTASAALKMQAEYKIGRCLEKSNLFDRAFSRYMNVVYPFVRDNADRTPYSIMWFTRSAFGAAAIKERAKDWIAAVQVYQRVVEANVPAQEEALKRIANIKQENWLLFEQAEDAE